MRIAAHFRRLGIRNKDVRTFPTCLYNVKYFKSDPFVQSGRAKGFINGRSVPAPRTNQALLITSVCNYIRKINDEFVSNRNISYHRGVRVSTMIIKYPHLHHISHLQTKARNAPMMRIINGKALNFPDAIQRVGLSEQFSSHISLKDNQREIKLNGEYHRRALGRSPLITFKVVYHMS